MEKTCFFPTAWFPLLHPPSTMIRFCCIQQRTLHGHGFNKTNSFHFVRDGVWKRSIQGWNGDFWNFLSFFITVLAHGSHTGVGRMLETQPSCPCFR